MSDSPDKQRRLRQDAQAVELRRLLAEAGYQVSVSTQNRVRYSDTDGRVFYLEVEELTD